MDLLFSLLSRVLLTVALRLPVSWEFAARPVWSTHSALLDRWADHMVRTYPAGGLWIRTDRTFPLAPSTLPGSSDPEGR